MPLSIPTTQAVTDRNVANLEANLHQNTPANLLAFNRVLAKMEALNYVELYKFAAERALQNFAMTASEAALERIGSEYGVVRNPAEATVLSATIIATTGIEIPRNHGFIGDANGVRYFTLTAVVATAGIATLSLQAEETGVAGNLLPSDTLTISSQVAGVTTTATVSAVDNTGDDIEDLEDYRQRVLSRIRAVLGGGNSTDYKTWGEGVTGVRRVYPYAGKPEESPPSYPGDRTVYVEATTSVDPDGIASQPLLDEVRAAINADPVSGKARPPLGITDDTLYVQSITRTSFDVTITGLSVSADSVVEAKADLSVFLTLYFLSLRPYVESLDLIQERNDTITDVTVSKIVQDVLSTYGGTAREVSFDAGLGPETTYTLAPNEKAKLGSIGYVA